MSSERELQRGVNFSGLVQRQKRREVKKRRRHSRDGASRYLIFRDRKTGRQTVYGKYLPLAHGACVRVFVYLRKYLVGRQWVGRPICVGAALAPLRRVKIISLPTAPPSVYLRPLTTCRCPAHLFWRPTADQEPKKELRTQERTRHTQELRTKNETPRTCPENSPAHLAPHTLTGARKGVLESRSRPHRTS
jgi:hypothetical protein